MCLYILEHVLLLLLKCFASTEINWDRPDLESKQEQIHSVPRGSSRGMKRVSQAKGHLPAGGWSLESIIDYITGGTEKVCKPVIRAASSAAAVELWTCENVLLWVWVPGEISGVAPSRGRAGGGETDLIWEGNCVSRDILSLVFVCFVPSFPCFHGKLLFCSVDFALVCRVQLFSGSKKRWPIKR